MSTKSNAGGYSLRRQSVRGDGAAQGEHLHPSLGSPAEGLAELGVGGVVGRYIFGTGELDDETQGGLIPRLTGGDQLLQVLHPPQGGGVGEADHAVLLQSDPLHLHKAPV